MSDTRGGWFYLPASAMIGGVKVQTASGVTAATSLIQRMFLHFGFRGETSQTEFHRGHRFWRFVWFK